MTLDRRSFLAATASITAASLAETQAFAAIGPNLPVVDTHQHLWDLTKFRMDWLGKDGPLSRNFVTKDYLEATWGLNVVKAVYMEVDVVEDQKDLEAEHYIELVKDKKQPTVAAVVGCRPFTTEFQAYAKRYRDAKAIKGFRQVVGHGDFDAQFIKNIQFLAEVDKSYDLCLPGKHLAAAVKVVDQCPETRFILDHCGNADCKAFLKEGERDGQEPGHDPDEWRKNIEKLASFPNVICKISGIVATVPKAWSAETLAPAINHCLDSFGPDRVVFGSDWPVCLKGATLAKWLAALKEIVHDRPLVDQKKLLAENAIKRYTLEA